MVKNSSQLSLKSPLELMLPVCSPDVICREDSVVKRAVVLHTRFASGEQVPTAMHENYIASTNS